MFSVYIQQELLQQLVLNSIVSTIHTAIIRVDTIGMVVYNQFQAERFNLKYLYEFQLQNNINAQSQMDDCLQQPHSQKFYSYQFCYGLYGQDKNLSNFTQIQTYTALQNQLIPFFQSKYVPIHYNIKYGKTIFLSQYQGKYTQEIDKPLLNALQYMEDFKSVNYVQKLTNSTGSVFLSLRAIDKQLYLGAILNQSENPYYRFTQSEQYFNQRLLQVLESGLILSDSKNQINGKQLQNTSVTGFNSEQFQKIKNFANKKGTVINECQFQFKIQILCLNNMYNKQQIVFSKYLVKSGYYFIAIVDTKSLSQIETDFNQKLEELIDNMFLNLGIQYVMAFIICIILQIIFIRKLNKPLEDLQKTAKAHINNFQNTIHQIASVKQSQNQTQKLSQAFFNLITLNTYNKQKQQKQLIQDSQLKQSKRTIMWRQSQKMIIQIRRYIFKKQQNQNKIY